MDEIIDVKCPWCSSVIKIKTAPGIEGKVLRCPTCKNVAPFVKYKRVVRPQQSEDDGDTKVGGFIKENLIIGKLIVPSLGLSYQLKPGKNIIGRKASASAANFQIPTGESKKMSREHLVIEVKRVPTVGYNHYVSLFKERVNKTTINNTQLQPGDTLILQSGDIIKLPDIDIRFELPDDDETQIS